MEKSVSPWSVLVTLDQIPETGLHMEIEAPDEVCTAIAKLTGARSMSKLKAVFDLTRRGAGVQVDGQVSGRVGQTCVVTLEPIESDIDETVDLRFSPQADEPDVAGKEIEIDAADVDEEPPEALVGGKIDLGAVATEFLILGIDPYPRKEGVEFTPPKAEDKGVNPFAALAALKKGPDGAKS